MVSLFQGLSIIYALSFPIPGIVGEFKCVDGGVVVIDNDIIELRWGGVQYVWGGVVDGSH